MSCNDHDKMNPVVHALYHVKEWDKKKAKQLQEPSERTNKKKPQGIVRNKYL